MPYSAITVTVISLMIVPTSNEIATHARSSCMRSMTHSSVFVISLPSASSRLNATISRSASHSGVLFVASSWRSRASTRSCRIFLAAIDSR